MALNLDFSKSFIANNFAYKSDSESLKNSIGVVSADGYYITGIPITKAANDRISSITFSLSVKQNRAGFSTAGYSYFICLLDEKYEATSSKASEAYEKCSISTIKENIPYLRVKGTDETWSTQTVTVALKNFLWESGTTKYLYIFNTYPYPFKVNDANYSHSRFLIQNISISSYQQITDFPEYTNINIPIQRMTENDKSYNYDYYNKLYRLGHYGTAGTNRPGKFELILPNYSGIYSSITFNFKVNALDNWNYVDLRWALSTTNDNRAHYAGYGEKTESGQIETGTVRVSSIGTNKLTFSLSANTVSKLEKNKKYYLYIWGYSYNSGHIQIGSIYEHSIIASFKILRNNTIKHQLWNFTNNEGNKESDRRTYILGETSYPVYQGEKLEYSSKQSISPPKGAELKSITYLTSNGYTNGTLPYNPGLQTLNQSVSYNYKFIDYNITYNLNLNNGSTDITNNNASTYNIHYGITFNAPSRIGYDFIEWQKNGSKITSINPNPATSFADVNALYSYLNERAIGDVTIDAIWKAKPYTYNIKYLSSSGILLSTDEITYNFDSTNSINPIEITYYNKPDSKSIIWDEESKTINFEYTPIEHIIEYRDENEGYIDTATYNIENTNENKKYSLLTLQDKNGYEFLGWSTIPYAETEYFTSIEIPTDTKPTTTILFAQWKPTIRYYKIEYYLQDIDSNSVNYNILKESILSQGLVGDEMVYKENSYEGFTFFKADFNNGEENIIKEDGTSIIKLYYNRNKYSLTLDNVNKGNYYYEEEIKIPLEALETGYKYVPKAPFSGLFEENNELYTKIIMPAYSINTSIPVPQLIEYNLIIDYSNGKLSEDGEIQERFEGTYNIINTIELPYLIGKEIVIKPIFKGWYGTQENKILDIIPIINNPIILKDNPNGERLIGDRTYVAQFSYQIGEQELFGSSKLIYIKKEIENDPTWTLGNLLPNKEV